MIEIIIAVVGILIGSGIAFFVVNSKNNGKAKLIIDEAQKNAEQIKKEKILQAKEKFIELKSEHEKVINSRERKMVEETNCIGLGMKGEKFMIRKMERF